MSVWNDVQERVRSSVGEELYIEDCLPDWKWLAASAMQKAIRRSDFVMACLAASTLLRLDSNRTWWRLIVTAFEDIGLADRGVVMEVATMFGNKAVRVDIGERKVLRYLLKRMCEAPKSRTLGSFEWAIDHYLKPCLDDGEWWMLQHYGHDQLLTMALDTDIEPLSRVAALCILAGFKGDDLPFKGASPDHVKKALFDSSIDPETLFLVTMFVRMKWNMALSMMVLSDQSFEVIRSVALPKDKMVCGFPGYAYDMHTGEGKRAIAYFRKMVSEITEISDSSSNPHKALSLAVFAMEGCLVDPCARFEIDYEMGHRWFDGVSVELDLPKKDFVQLCALTMVNIPKLHEARQRIMA